MEKKLLTLEAKVDDLGVLEGHGNTTGNIDRGRDVTLPGAYKNLDAFVRDGAILIGHDWGGLPVAMPMDAREDDKGLFFTAKFHNDDMAQRARNVVKERLENGKSVGLSIGYSVMDSEMGTKDGTDVRFLKAIEVHEISIVTVPMNPASLVTGAKDFTDRYEGAFATLEAVTEELGRIRELRVKDGRKWPSDLKQVQIEAFAAKTEGLLSTLKSLLTSPAEEVDEEALAELDAIYRALEARDLAPL